MYCPFRFLENRKESTYNIRKKRVNNMAYNKKADDNYRKKCNTIGLKYTPNESNEYIRIRMYCDIKGMSLQKYIKELIKQDLDSKGIEYADSMDNMDL